MLTEKVIGGKWWWRRVACMGIPEDWLLKASSWFLLFVAFCLTCSIGPAENKGCHQRHCGAGRFSGKRSSKVYMCDSLGSLWRRVEERTSSHYFNFLPSSGIHFRTHCLGWAICLMPSSQAFTSAPKILKCLNSKYRGLHYSLLATFTLARAPYLCNTVELCWLASTLAVEIVF